MLSRYTCQSYANYLRLNVRGIDWELIWILFHSIKGNYKLKFTIEQSGLLHFSLQRIKECWVWIAAKQCYVHHFSKVKAYLQQTVIFRSICSKTINEIVLIFFLFIDFKLKRLTWLYRFLWLDPIIYFL